MGKNKDICGGYSPWHGSKEVVTAALSLHRQGTDISGLSEDQLLEIYRTAHIDSSAEEESEYPLGDETMRCG